MTSGPTTTYDLRSAFDITTTVTLTDPEGLGIVVSELASYEQAAFLTGLADGFTRFDGEYAARDKQLAFIATEFEKSPDVGRRIWTLLHDLAEHINAVILTVENAPPASTEPIECCASGSCEVCRPGSGWTS